MTTATPVIFAFISVVFLFLPSVLSQNTTSEIESTVKTVSTTVPADTTQNPTGNISCEVHDNDCKGCVSNAKCYYCESDKKCYFKITEVLTDDKCSLKDIHYLTCRLNFKYLLIVVGSLIGVALLIIVIFCCICCCKKKGLKISKDDLKWARQKEERKQIAADKRKERAERTEEIRKKYGLVKDANPYQKFDA